jgi:hypothetical protein
LHRVGELVSGLRGRQEAKPGNAAPPEGAAPAAAAPPAFGPHFHDAGCLAAQQRQQKMSDLYLLGLDACIRAGVEEWWRGAFLYENYPDPALALRALKAFCLDHTLVEAGDAASFHRIYELLAADGTLEGDEDGRYLLALTGHLAAVLRKLEALPPQGGKRLIAALSVLDDAVDDLAAFCAPSLKGREGAAPALREATLLVSARESNARRIEAALRKAGLEGEIIWEPVPAPLLANSAERRRDWLLGGLQSLHLLHARRAGADFLSIDPSAVYSDRYFETLAGLAASGKRTIFAAPLPVDREMAKGPLEAFRRGESLAVPATDLVGIGLEVSVARRRVVLTDHPDAICGTSPWHYIIWEGEALAELHASRHEIAFAGHEVLAAFPSRIHLPIGAAAHRLRAAGAEAHLLGASDQAAALLLNRAGGRNADAVEKLLGRDFAPALWRAAGSDGVAAFRQAVELPLPGYGRTGLRRKTSGEITAEYASMGEALDNAKPYNPPTPSRLLAAFEVLRRYEVSEYGRENWTGVFDAARRLHAACRFAPGALAAPERKELIRACMNFDMVDHAVAYARDGGEETAFINEFLVDTLARKSENIARAEALKARVPGARFAVIGSILWGDAYVDRFMDYCVPSLLAEGNLPALAETRRVVHSIVTTERDRRRIGSHPSFARLSGTAEVVFTCFPEAFLARREQSGYNFYFFYGLLDHHSVFWASALGAELYLLPVDCLYADGCLRNMSGYLDRGADCASIAGLEALEEPLLAYFAGRADARGALAIGADELLRKAGEFMHPVYRSVLMSRENERFYRHPRELVWPLEGQLAVHSIYMHPLAVSSRMLSRPFHPHHENVDYALLPRLLQADGRLAVIEDARDAAIAHFSAAGQKQDFLPGGFSLRNLLEVHRYDYALHRHCFATRQRFPCAASPYPPSQDYAAELELIKSALARFRFRPGGDDEARRPR